MKTLRYLPVALSLICGPLFADQNIAGNVTITGGTSTGNLTVTGMLDSEGNVVTFGTQGTVFGAALLYQDDGIDTFTFNANRNPASWLWQHSAAVAAMRLDSAHQLILYKSDGTTAGVTLAPASNSIRLGTHANGTLTADANGVITAGGGFAVAGGITNTNGTLTGGTTGLTLNAGGTNQNIMLNSSGGDLIFSTNSAERMRIRTTGNIGIGTAAPAGKLTLQFDGNANNLLSVEDRGYSGITGAKNIALRVGYAHGNGINQNPTQGYLDLIKSIDGNTALATNSLTGAPLGNVGIGATTPSERLHVFGGKLKIQSGSNGYGWIYGEDTNHSIIMRGDRNGTAIDATNYHQYGGLLADGTKGHRFWTGGALASQVERMRIANDGIYMAGNVGIGTSAPGEKLQVKGNLSFESANTSVFRIVPEPATNDRILQFENASGSGTGGFAFKATDAGLNAVRFKINNDGNVGIGTASPGFVVGSGLEIERINSSPTLRLQRAGDGTSAEIAAGVAQLYIGVDAENTAANSNINFAIDGTDRVRIDSSGFVGIGTTNPQAPLQVRREGGGGSVRLSIDNILGASTRDAFFTIVPDNGNDTGGFLFRTHNGAAGIVNALAIAPTGNVGIGTTAPTHKLAVAGTIRAQEIIVDNTNWADYVFEEDYRLAPLAEVESHIKAKGHLPGIPSAAEVAEHGVSMGEMQAKLLSKVEELTLHLIAQEKQMKSLQAIHASEIAALRAELSQLKGQHP